MSNIGVEEITQGGGFATMVAASPRPLPVDGRHARRERATDAVVHATIDLFGRGELFPTALQIATHAKVSLRSLFRYFESLERLSSLALGAWEQQFGALRLSPPPGAGLDRRIDALARHQSAFWQSTAPYRHAVQMLSTRLPDAGVVIDGWAALTRTNVEDHLGAEMAAFDDDTRRLRLAAAEAAVQAGAVDHLLRSGLTVDEVAAASSVMLRGIVVQPAVLV